MIQWPMNVKILKNYVLWGVLALGIMSHNSGEILQRVITLEIFIKMVLKQISIQSMAVGKVLE